VIGGQGPSPTDRWRVGRGCQSWCCAAARAAGRCPPTGARRVTAVGRPKDLKGVTLEPLIIMVILEYIRYYNNNHYIRYYGYIMVIIMEPLI
jgi:hypothetical protein